jgi:hypothetical protein
MGRGSAEGNPPGQQLEEHHAQRVDVGSSVDLYTFGLLR